MMSNYFQKYIAGYTVAYIFEVNQPNVALQNQVLKDIPYKSVKSIWL